MGDVNVTVDELVLGEARAILLGRMEAAGAGKVALRQL